MSDSQAEGVAGDNSDDVPRISFRTSVSGRFLCLPAEPTGMKTPPIHAPLAVPFSWEEKPGKPLPRHCYDAVHCPVETNRRDAFTSPTERPSSPVSVQDLICIFSDGQRSDGNGEEWAAPSLKKVKRNRALHQRAAAVARLLAKVCKDVRHSVGSRKFRAK